MTITLSGTRRIEIEDGVWFEMRGEQFTDWAKAAKFAKAFGAEIEVDSKGKVVPDRMTSVILGGYALLSRIIAWGGVVNEDGSEAECNEQNLIALFGQRPDLMNIIGEQLGIRADAETKNSEASQTT